MKLAEVSIKRPVFTVMIVIALMVLGYSSFTDMNTDLMPNIDFPFVVIQTFYPGAGAEAVETDVTKKIEDAVNPISGVKHIMSTSQEGYSLTFVEFILEKDGQVAAQDVREKVAAIRDDLPQDIEEPKVIQYDPNDEAIISITVSGERPLRDMTEYVKDNIQKTIESIPGVGSVSLVGGFNREINIFLDIDGLEAHEIPIFKVQSAIAAANLEIPGGRVNEKNREYLVRTMGKLTSVDQFNNIAIDNPQGQPIYLKDIAEVIDGVEEQRSLSRVDGKDALTLNITRQSGANTVEVARAVKDEIANMQTALPPDMRLNIVVDNSTFIEDSIHEVLMNIYFGGLLAVLVIFLFLADIRSTIISAIAIPASIIATFTFMKALGFTLNILSLLALAIAVGLLIDDAIVVIENIFRRLQNGESARKAAFSGTKEIGLAVMATTFSIVVVFLPVAFMKGIIGRFFYQFGMTVAFSVVVSLFIAFSLTPMLSSRWLDIGDNKRPPAIFRGKSIKEPEFILWKLFYWAGYFIVKPLVMLINFVFLILWKIYQVSLIVTRPWNRLFDKVGVIYKALLGWSLNHRIFIISAAVLSFILAMYLGGLVGFEFQPETDDNRFVVTMETPPGTDLETTSDAFSQVENILNNEFEGIELILTTIGDGQKPVNEGQLFVKLVDKDLRPLSARQMIDSTRIILASVPGIKYAVAKEAHQGGSGTAVELSIRGIDGKVLAGLTRQVEDIFRSVPGVVDLDNSMSEGKPELQVNIDRELANDLGLNISQIGSTVRFLVEGDVVTRYKEGDKEYDVRVRLKEADRTNTGQIERLLIASNKEIPGKKEFLVPLGNIANMKKTTAIGEYKRLDRLSEVRVGSNVTADAFAGTVQEQVMEQVNKIDLPPGYYIGPSGMSEIMVESFKYMFEALFLAVIFIYLLLASQFESFFDPFSIMFSLPLSLVGAIIALLIMGDSISIISMIGIIMLMGLVTKNAILLIDFVNQRRRGGMSRANAILDAGPIRLRPIMMTTISLIFGVLPIALGIGPGAEMRAPMARAVIGGMTSSTLLTLVVVPIVYTVIDDIIAFFKGGETITVEKELLENDGSNG